MKINDIITEARGSFYFRHNNQKSAVSLFNGSTSNPPAFMFVSHIIDGNSKVSFFKVNSAKFKKLMSIGYGYSIPEVQSLSSEEKLELYNSFIRYFYNTSLLESQEKIDKFFETYNKFKNIVSDAVKEFSFNNKHDLAKYMLTKGKISPTTVQTLTGITIEDEIESDVMIGQSKILFPDNMRESRKQDIIKLVTDSNTILESHGLTKLTKTSISVRPINGTTVGFYDLKTKMIVIDPAAKVSYMALHTVLHEYAHKLWYEFFSEDQKKEIKEKFLEEYKTKTVDYSITDKAVEDAYKRKQYIDSTFKDINVGDVIEYKGRSPKFKKNSPYVIVTKTDDNLYINPQYGGSGRLGGPFAAFVGKGFYHNGIHLDYPKGEETPQEYKAREGWFPTRYSEKNEEEWFSELFAFYLMDELKDQPVINFVKKFI